jgi:hypothetical protein
MEALIPCLSSPQVVVFMRCVRWPQAVCNGSVSSLEDARRLTHGTLLAHQIPGSFLEAATIAALNALLGEHPDTHDLRRGCAHIPTPRRA